MQSSECKLCNINGLTILLARYCVVPEDVPLGLPAWAGGQHVKDVNIGPHYRYALRTLRAGFVYLFYDKNQFGSNKWECYTVHADGSPVKQPNPEMAEKPGASPQCSTTGNNAHNAHNLHMIVIERPDKCGKAWIAFSEHKWSNDTLKRYTADAKLRDARMQTIDVKALAATGQHPHGHEATKAALETILEYSPLFDINTLPNPSGTARKFSREDGGYDDDLLTTQSTRYPWSMRTGQAGKLVERMKARAKRADGSFNLPAVIALWDAVGITHELNGFRNEAAGRLQQYGEERELQITCCNDLRTLKQGAADVAEDQVEAHRALAFSATAQRQQGSGAGMRKLAAQHPNDPRYAEAADLQTQWEAQQVPSYYSQRMYLVLQHYPANMWRSEIDKLKSEVNRYVASREPNHKKTVADARLNSWDRFAKYIDTEGAQKTFERNWDAFLTAADKLIDARTEALVKWLEAPLFLDTLEDCHSKNLADGIEFEDKVGTAIYGIGSSKTGAQKLDAWVKQAKATTRSNLLWRAIALNQEEGMVDLDHALEAAEQAKTERTIATAVNVESNLTKIAKVFAGIHKNAASIRSANDSAAAAEGSFAFGARINPINTRNLDKNLTTAGDAILRHFKIDGLADYLCEKIMQHVLSVRALINPEDSRTLIVFQAADEPAARGRLLQRLSTANTFLTEASADMRAAQSERLKAAWGKIKAGGEDKIRGPRLAALMLIIEGFNFQKLLYDCYKKNDWKSWSSLAASGMMIASNLIDIASAPVKEEFAALADKGAASWSMQRLKLVGGVLSIGATAIGCLLDWKSAGEYREKQRTLLYILYDLKVVLGIASAGLTLAATFTHSAPLIGNLCKRRALQGAAVAVGEEGGIAASILGARILFMSVGAWISVIGFGIQIIIWFQPDDLQVWCERCAFGKDRDKTWTPKKQYDELLKSLKAIGVPT